MLLLLKMEVRDDRSAAIITAIIRPRRPEDRTEPPTVNPALLGGRQAEDIGSEQDSRCSHGRGVGDF